jgi:hypothetical protein
MRKLLSSPVKMALSDAENSLYQKSLVYITELSLNLMAVKVTNHPEDFLGWCIELLDVCKNRVNRDLLYDAQVKPLQKLISILELAASASQFKMARIAPWPIFVGFIEQQADLHALEERLRLLDYVRELQHTSLAEMSEVDRLAFSGKHTTQHVHTTFNFDCEWFASTKGAKLFHKLLAEEAIKFDKALDFIPLTGDVTPGEYQQFVSAYKTIFKAYTKDKTSGERAPLAPATRLLAMRRPDQFIAITSTKIEVLCQGLGIVKFNNYDFDSYWQDLIGTIRTFAWWHQSEPTDEREAKLWRTRAILVDLFMHVDEDFAFGSNFLKTRDKKLKSHTESTTSYRRSHTKLSTEEIVDKALTVDGMPDYIINKRATIINEVKKGKNVEHVIGLMRAIFG